MERILIVEDDQAIAELERDYLELSGYKVEIATDGETGLDMGLTGQYDLILLDVMLPRLSGLEICEELRKKMEQPILMVSAKKEDIDKIRALGLGADDYISKPFSPSELVARVKAHLSRYKRLTQVDNEGNSQAHLITVHHIRLDTLAHKVFILDQEVVFTTKEFELLKFFIEHPNQVFNKDDLFELIWGMEALSDTTTVVVHVRRLREKIEFDSNKPRLIETIWGTGYRFNGE
ncbi:response regulator transcription factor [Listeria aquatica]|uniref:Response regulator transcription factor n=1 Tax=Listeria aquatica TaxID=1494960 RepID=A0A841ZPA7_9LIST|nr:response regulator transcription factor [Listeria aquatica]MBC1521993.1 response regulator transcription factor [Listeria aquatica]